VMAVMDEILIMDQTPPGLKLAPVSWNDLLSSDALELVMAHRSESYAKLRPIGILLGFGLMAGAGFAGLPEVLAGIHLDLPTSVAQTAQSRSDRVVGRWRSSSGPEITLAYSGNPATLWIQVFLKPGRIRPREDFTASWIDQGRFTYKASDGSIIIATVDPSGRTIRLKSNTGWSATWTRLP
jgi:hypothetical protein